MGDPVIGKESSEDEGEDVREGSDPDEALGRDR